MKKYMPIIKDALILLAVSTLFVTAMNTAFKGLKKTAEADSLVTAITQGNAEAVQEILSEKGFQREKGGYADLAQYIQGRVKKTDHFGRTPLMWTGYANFASAKATAEADPKRLPLVDLLVKNGADVNATDKDGWTPLMWASWSGLPQVVAKLIELGASVATADRQGNTPLMLAAMRGHADVVKILTEKGADKSLTAKNGKRAADFAQDGMKQYPARAEAYRALMPML